MSALQSIAIQLYDGHVIMVAARVFGRWAAHGAIGPYSRMFAITYIPKGQNLGDLSYFDSQEEAVAVAKKLSDYVLHDPPTREDAFIVEALVAEALDEVTS